ncbi:MAG: FAD-dependent monooxygenase [Alphaproteobacteria bacterium]|nr:FAD-dependent monooxygenase [Alphaproteobacteria bacterium]MDE2336206.1 FAD-dependent monooxygenase [Alphaproteobacteria bacterium]
MTVHVVGGGLVGPLMAVYLAQKGFDVALYERRPDMRRADVPAGRSINLAVTARGLKALGEVGLRDAVMKISIPMKGRMIHDAEGKTSFLPYGQKEDEVIYAASRGLLNKVLLEAAGKHKNVEMKFDEAFTVEDLVALEKAPVIAADGAWSIVRKHMLENVHNFDYSQSFQTYGYKELVIPSDAQGGFRMEKNALHIWPRNQYMLIALPNTDGSFTVTLFYPYDGFEKLKTPEDVKTFFKRDFPDVVPLMPALAGDFFANPTGALVTVKCAPWNDGNRVLIGDAAHAIVPFFAQGMNSGFEDCALLNSLIGKNPDWEKVFAEFCQKRKADADAIADMAIENFHEMRAGVTDPKFALKKQVGFALEQRWPEKFIPRYSMVIFHPEIPYAEAKQRGIMQGEILEELCANIDAPEELDWQLAERLLA